MYLVGVESYSPGIGGDYPNVYQFPKFVTDNLAEAERVYQELAKKDWANYEGWDKAYLVEVPVGQLFPYKDIKCIHGKISVY